MQLNTGFAKTWRRGIETGGDRGEREEERERERGRERERKKEKERKGDEGEKGKRVRDRICQSQVFVLYLTLHPRRPVVVVVDSHKVNRLLITIRQYLLVTHQTQSALARACTRIIIHQRLKKSSHSLATPDTKHRSTG